MRYEKAKLDNFRTLVFIVVAVVAFGPTPGQGATCPPSCRTCDSTFTYCTSCNSRYTLYNGTCEPCGTNCVTCTYGGNCSLCDYGNGIDPTNSSNCEPCKPTFCSNCPTDMNICTSCNAGYGQYPGSQNCGLCSPFCSASCNIAGAGKCDQCDSGYGLNSNGSCSRHSSTNSSVPPTRFSLSRLALGLVIGVPCGVVFIILLAVIIALLITRRKRLMKIGGAEGKAQSSVQNSYSTTQGNQTMRSYEQLDDTSSERHYAYMNAKVSDADSELHYSYMNKKVSDADSESYSTVVNHNPNRNTLYA